MSQNTNSLCVNNILPDNQTPTTLLRFDAATGVFIEQQKTEPFLKGPISIAWLHQSAVLGGKTLNVALAIRWLAGMNGNKPIKLTNTALENFHVSRDSATDALRRMEAIGLVKLYKKHSQRHLIEVLEVRK